jgi:hypothetical protein
MQLHAIIRSRQAYMLHLKVLLLLLPPSKRSQILWYECHAHNQL